MAFILLSAAAFVSMGLLSAAAGVLCSLVGMEIMSVVGALMCVAGIVLSGFGFVLMGRWTGLAIVSTAVAGIGFCVIIALLLDKAVRKFWNFCRDGFDVGADVWTRMLRKIESWLIADKNIPHPAEEKVEKEADDKPSEEEQEEIIKLAVLPGDIQPCEADGKEGL